MKKEEAAGELPTIPPPAMQEEVTSLKTILSADDEESATAAVDADIIATAVILSNTVVLAANAEDKWSSRLLLFSPGSGVETDAVNIRGIIFLLASPPAGPSGRTQGI
jgi:hypothetical protein